MYETVADFVVNVNVVRKQGASGRVACNFKTEADSATPNYDYVETSGVLTFEAGQSSAEIPVTIKAKGRYEGTEIFRLTLTEPTGGATFDQATDGG